MDTSLSDFDGTLVLVGAGKMGGAMLEGWHRLGLKFDQVIAIEPEPAPEIMALGQRGLRINPSLDMVAARAVVVELQAEAVPAFQHGAAHLAGAHQDERPVEVAERSVHRGCSRRVTNG